MSGPATTGKTRALFREHPALRAVAGIGVALCGIALTFTATPGPAPMPAVLAAKTDLPAGTVLTAGDLQEVHEAQPGAEAAPASSESSFLGKTLRTELPAGMLLGAADIGAYPPAGYAQVSLALKPGQFPSDLAAGQRVGIVPLGADGSGPYTTDTTTGSATGGAWVVDGQLVSMAGSAGSGEDIEVVDVLVPVSQAPAVIAAPGAALMGLDGAGR